MTRTRIAAMKERILTIKPRAEPYRFDETKFKHAGQYVSHNPPTFLSAIKVLEDDVFRRALQSTVKSYLAKPMQETKSCALPVAGFIRILFKRLDGERKTIYVSPKQKVGEFRASLAERNGFCSHEIRIVFQGSLINDAHSFEQSHITDNSIIHWILNVSGS